MRSGVGCPSGTPGAERRHGRKHARTQGLPYLRRRPRSHLHLQRGQSRRDAASLSVIRRDLHRPGEDAGAGKERVVKLTPGNRRKIREALALPRPGDRGVSQGRPYRESPG